MTMRSLAFTNFLLLFAAPGAHAGDDDVPAPDARARAWPVDQVGPEEAGRVVDRFVALLDSQSRDFVFLPAEAGG